MTFGKSTEEAKAEASRSEGGSDFFRYIKDETTTLRIVDEPAEWTWYWEHFNPGGYPFPCLSDDRKNCHGCNSDDEKMAKASRKVAMNCFDGEYTNIWKMPKTVAEKLEKRYDRLGTVKDRDYMIMRWKKDNGFYEYDVEGQEKTPSQADESHKKEAEPILQQMWDDAWGDNPKKIEPKVEPAEVKAPPSWVPKVEEKKVVVDPATEGKAEKNEVDETTLRAMEPWDLAKFCLANGLDLPDGMKDSNAIVDWMLTQVS